MRTILSRQFLILLSAVCFGFGFGCASNQTEVLVLPLDGSLSFVNGREPVESSPPTFVSFRKRKVLRAGSGWIAKYFIPDTSLREGTVQFWIKPDFLPESSAILTLCGSDGGPCLGFYGSDRRLTIRWRPARGSRVQTYHSDGISPDRWTMITFAWQKKILSDAKIDFYVDGRSPELADQISPGFEQGAGWQDGILQIGSSSGPGGFRIRDFTLSSSVLAETEIISRYAADVQSYSRIVWSSDEMMHFTGQSVPDTEASGGRAWTGDTRMAYVQPFELPAQEEEYQLSFRLKITRNVSPGMIEGRVLTVLPDGTEEEFASRKNDMSLTGKTNSYREFPLAFRTGSGRIFWEFHSRIPGKRSLLLDTITLKSRSGGFEKQWSATTVEHMMGIPQDDPDATDGKAWGNNITLFYGPYTGIGYPGRYRATWRFKVGGNVPAGERIATFDIFAHDGFHAKGRRGNKKYNEFILGPGDIQERGKWQSRSLNFRYDGADMMEFRVFARQLEPGALLLDTVTVERTD